MQSKDWIWIKRGLGMAFCCIKYIGRERRGMKKELQGKLFCTKDGAKVDVFALSEEDQRKVMCEMQRRWMNAFASLEGYEITKFKPKD